METGKNSQATYSIGTTNVKELQASFSLIIESEIDQFSYAILDKKANQCVGLSSFRLDGVNRREDLKDILSTNEVLNFPFSNRTILLSNRECVFIPEEIFAEEKNDFYIKSSFDVNYEGSCFSQKLAQLTNYCVFKAPSWLLNLYNEHLSGASIVHSSAYLAEALYRLSLRTEGIMTHVHFKKTFFEMYIFDQGKMLFYNSFSYQTSEDIAYFIMYALTQWEVKDKAISVSGVLDEESDELYWLRKYLQNITVFPKTELLSYPAAIERPTAYLNLLNPSLCEL